MLKQPFCVGVFICGDCEYKRLAFNDTHTKNHALVRIVQKVEESKVSMEEKLEAFEGKLGSVEGQLGSVEGRLGSLEGRLESVEGRLGSIQDELLKMRQLLSMLYEKGTEGSPGDPPTKDDVLGAVTAEPTLGGPLPLGGEGDGGADEERDRVDTIEG